MWTPGSITWTDTSQNWIQKKQLLQPPGVHDLQFWLKPTQYCGIAWFLPQSNSINMGLKIRPTTMWCFLTTKSPTLVSWQLPWQLPPSFDPAPPASSSPRSAALIPLEVASWGGGRPWRFNGLVSKSGSRGSSGRFSRKNRYGSAHPHTLHTKTAGFYGDSSHHKKMRKS